LKSILEIFAETKKSRKVHTTQHFYSGELQLETKHQNCQTNGATIQRRANYTSRELQPGKCTTKVSCPLFLVFVYCLRVRHFLLMSFLSVLASLVLVNGALFCFLVLCAASSSLDATCCPWLL
jgi:hypothetical protein